MFGGVAQVVRAYGSYLLNFPAILLFSLITSIPKGTA